MNRLPPRPREKSFTQNLARRWGIRAMNDDALGSWSRWRLFPFLKDEILEPCPRVRSQQEKAKVHDEEWFQQRESTSPLTGFSHWEAGSCFKWTFRNEPLHSNDLWNTLCPWTSNDFAVREKAPTSELNHSRNTVKSDYWCRRHPCCRLPICLWILGRTYSWSL